MVRYYPDKNGSSILPGLNWIHVRRRARPAATCTELPDRLEVAPHVAMRIIGDEPSGRPSAHPDKPSWSSSASPARRRRQSGTARSHGVGRHCDWPRRPCDRGRPSDEAELNAIGRQARAPFPATAAGDGRLRLRSRLCLIRPILSPAAAQRRSPRRREAHSIRRLHLCRSCAEGTGPRRPAARPEPPAHRSLRIVAGQISGEQGEALIGAGRIAVTQAHSVLLTTAAGVVAMLAVVVFFALAGYRGQSHAHH
ncbi:hypothetical protein J2S76_002260 [Ancylobacter vacuolatus]|uniref:Uncharacterized protein n=1 Tax=Ancylobacter vacuolatus TaxID=223389 RepID=A0ABU0DHN9_9HYPH|nr:hypothetical protein [Ancylobacter vacuolatus]